MTTPKTKEPTKTTEQEVDELLEAVDDTEPVATEKDKAIAASSVVPLHVVASNKEKDMRPGAVLARKKRGRPKKVAKKPTVDELEYHAEMQRQQAEFVEADALVTSTKMRTDSPEMLQALKERLARMTAVLEFMRIEGQKLGKMDGQLVSRQVAAIREIAQIELKIRELGAQTIDLNSEPLQRVFAMFIEKIQQVARDVLSEQQFDIFFNKLETELDGWEEEAENLVR